MPYVFPNEDVFMGGIALLIIALVILRVKVSRQRQQTARINEDTEASIQEPKDTSPLV